jgi:ornithine cyclodeaminase/alanine dehydrogenase-like protein (mu-crystallin family)
MTTLTFLTADDIFERMNYLDAVRTLQRDLRNGLDPDADFERGSVDLAQGKFLLMPSESSQFAGVKVLTVTAENPARGLPLIQGVYVLTDAATLSPVAHGWSCSARVRRRSGTSRRSAASGGWST